jgi:eukaryotic-like serine/threonine-protein kinase
MALIQAAGAHNTAMGIGSETSVGGRYRLERQIGVGATARVWLAFDAVLERRVAVKMLDSPIGGEAAHIERFRREARAVAKVQHPHIVTVLDSGEHDGMPFIVLEYVEGETLKERIRRVGRLTVTEAVAFAIEVARALEAAHARGIVHRDVKPQNILLDAEGGAKVTDFGIARSGNEDGLTLGGRVLGTTDYISPEQALGHEVTGQSDLYSLGVVLYESLTGAVPFTGTSHIAVATMHVREDMPDVQRRRPEVSAALAAIVERATAKHLALRYGGARELIADLEEVLAIETARTGNAGREATVVLRSLPPSATNQLPMRVKHPVAMIISAALALAAAAAVAAFLLTRTHGGTPAPANLPRSVGEASVSLAQGAAHQYNPFGTTPEDPTRVDLDVPGRPARQVRGRALRRCGPPRGRQPGGDPDADAGLPRSDLGSRSHCPGYLQSAAATRNHSRAAGLDTARRQCPGGRHDEDRAEKRTAAPLLPAVDHRSRTRSRRRREVRPDRRVHALTSTGLGAVSRGSAARGGGARARACTTPR